MVENFRYFIVLTFLTFLSGCVTSQDVKSTFQTNSAELISKDEKKLQTLLVKFKTKLDKRNPNNFNKENEQKIYQSIKDFNKKLYLKYQGKVLKDYKDYLEKAFLKEPILNRNDYLILGICYMIAQSYAIEDFHALTAFQFDKEKLNNLYMNLQAIRWKIKVERTLNDEYLFLTWQNNWQIQLEKLLKKNPDISYEEIKELEFIKNKRETLFSHSNFSFEVILTQMIDLVKNSLEALGEEPRDLSISAVKFFIFL